MRKIFIFNLLFFTFFIAIAAQAAGLDVEFETSPLFANVQILPDDAVSRYVRVSNSAPQTQTIIAEAINESECTDFCLADQLQLNISSDNDVYYSDTLTNFFATGEVVLGQLTANKQKQYDFTVSFAKNSNNDYQNTATGFDLLIGFAGEGDNGPQIISSTGGGSGPLPGLTISSESALAFDGATVVVSWRTNYASTSQVVYGPVAGAPYHLNLGLTNFGYPFGSVEQTEKVTDHYVTLTNVLPGVYHYRVVSHASPPTIGFEQVFEVRSGSLKHENKKTQKQELLDDDVPPIKVALGEQDTSVQNSEEKNTNNSQSTQPTSQIPATQSDHLTNQLYIPPRTRLNSVTLNEVPKQPAAGAVQGASQQNLTPLSANNALNFTPQTPGNEQSLAWWWLLLILLPAGYYTYRKFKISTSK